MNRLGLNITPLSQADDVECHHASKSLQAQKLSVVVFLPLELVSTMIFFSFVSCIQPGKKTCEVSEESEQ